MTDKMNKIIACEEEQNRDEDRLHEQLDNWWNSLCKDDQEKAFFSVVKRITNAELIQNKTYRQILQEEFGFDSDYYYMGIICGFMSLHNAIVTPAEQGEMRQALREKREREKQLSEKFRLKSKCNICGFQSMDIYPTDNSMCPDNNCVGFMVKLL